MKRIFDILLSLIALIGLVPILIAVAAAVYIEDRGPVLFKQRRIGLGGTEFWILKFRSMVINAEKLGGFSTEDNDPRITSVGRIIRRTSLDELPQIVNVLKGDMSIVGPRPDVPAQRSLYTEEEWNIRHTVRPGITGLAQVKARSTCIENERKRLDLLYVQEANLWFDIKIILMTFKQVISEGGN
jgi:lipopolysaccharide/colanic/teichoic acid biosynthesis glycosyltransferase